MPAGRQMKIKQAIKELGETPNADFLSACTATGVGAWGHRDRRVFTASTGRYTRCPIWAGGRAGSGSRAEKEPLQAVPGRFSVRHLSHGSDDRVRLIQTL
jgi:hypothetical protein